MLHDTNVRVSLIANGEVACEGHIEGRGGWRGGLLPEVAASRSLPDQPDFDSVREQYLV